MKEKAKSDDEEESEEKKDEEKKEGAVDEEAEKEKKEAEEEKKKQEEEEAKKRKEEEEKMKPQPINVRFAVCMDTLGQNRPYTPEQVSVSCFGRGGVEWGLSLIRLFVTVHQFISRQSSFD